MGGTGKERHHWLAWNHAEYWTQLRDHLEGLTASVLDPLSARCEIVDLSHARKHVHELSALATRGCRKATQIGAPNATPATPLPCSP